MISNKKILLISPLSQEHSPDGYSNAASNMAAVLEMLAQEKTIHSIDRIDINKLHEYPIPLTFYDTIIVIFNPFYFLSPDIQNVLKLYLERGRVTYFQIVWETDLLPKSWKGLWESDLLTGFIAPSHFIENMLKKETKKPVFYIPHYVNINLFKRVNLQNKLKETIFTVLCAGQWTERKGHREAIIAYAKAVSSYPDCRLVVKYNRMPNDPVDVEGEVRKIIATNTAKLSSPVYCCGNSITKEELVNLYHQTSVLLYPSRGEGFGFFVAEMSSVGIPIIYTNWSSTAEVAKAPGNIPIQYLLDECTGMAQFGYEKGAKSAIPIMSDLIAALEYKYLMWKQNREFYYNESINNYKIIDEKYGAQAVKNCFIELFKSNDIE